MKLISVINLQKRQLRRDRMTIFKFLKTYYNREGKTFPSSLKRVRHIPVALSCKVSLGRVSGKEALYCQKSEAVE